METENVNLKNWKSLIKPTKLDVKIRLEIERIFKTEMLELNYL